MCSWGTYLSTKWILILLMGKVIRAPVSPLHSLIPSKREKAMTTSCNRDMQRLMHQQIFERFKVVDFYLFGLPFPCFMENCKILHGFWFFKKACTTGKNKTGRPMGLAISDIISLVDQFTHHLLLWQILLFLIVISKGNLPYKMEKAIHFQCPTQNYVSFSSPCNTIFSRRTLMSW